jgi:hypothetical protein
VPSFLQMDAGLLFRDEPNISWSQIPKSGSPPEMASKISCFCWVYQKSWTSYEKHIYIHIYIYQISYILNLSKSKVCLFFFWLLLLCHKIWDRSAADGSPSRGGTTFVGDPMVREPRGDGPTRECLDLQIGLMWLMVTYIHIWNCGRKWWWLMVINGYINGD